MTGPLLEIQSLQVRYSANPREQVAALQDVNIILHAGETLAVVGASGSGKTTLLQAILRLFRRSESQVRGRILFRGTDLLQISEKQMRRRRGDQIALVPQEPVSAFNPLRRLGPQLTEGLRLHKKQSRAQAEKQILDLLHLLGLRDGKRIFASYPHQLSTGMCQRALLAMAVACQPQLLLADEPTAALDAAHQNDVLDLLRSLQQRFGLTLLLVSHDLGLVAGYVDRIAVLHRGQIIECGATPAVLQNPKHPQTRELLAAARRVPNAFG